MHPDARKAGRELDARVAEKVMGWRHHEVSPNTEWMKSVLTEPPGSGYSKVPPYSTSIEAAWEVVEHLRMRGWKLSFYLTTGAQAQFFNSGNPLTYGSTVTAPTAPLAICLASLKAVGDLSGEE